MIEVLKLALKALNAGEHAHLIMNTDGIKDKVRQAIAELESQEPVAWADHGVVNWIADKQFKHASLLYTHPPQRKPLTDEQKLMCWARATCDADVEHKTEHQCLMDYADEIEAAHGIKE
jgi:hypothetical protein